MFPPQSRIGVEIEGHRERGTSVTEVRHTDTWSYTLTKSLFDIEPPCGHRGGKGSPIQTQQTPPRLHRVLPGPDTRRQRQGPTLLRGLVRQRPEWLLGWKRVVPLDLSLRVDTYVFRGPSLPVSHRDRFTLFPDRDVRGLRPFPTPKVTPLPALSQILPLVH